MFLSVSFEGSGEQPGSNLGFSIAENIREKRCLAAMASIVGGLDVVFACDAIIWNSVEPLLQSHP